MQIEISTRYLDKDSIARFDKVKSKTENCYLEALRSSPINFLESEYLPRIYVIPFVRKVILPDRWIFVFNEVLPDPLEEKYKAFFPSLPFLEVIEPKFVIANFAHELAHVIDFAVKPNRIEELWKKHKGNARLVHEELEQKISEEYYGRFKEPAKTWLYELDEESNKNRVLNQINESGAEVREFRGIYAFGQFLKSPETFTKEI